MTSIGSSTSRTSSDDDSRYSYTQINQITYIDDVRISEPKDRLSQSTLHTFKMVPISTNICPRCSKAVYVAEGIKAAGKVKQSNV